MATEELRIIISADDKASPATKALTANLDGLGKLASGALKVGLAAAATGVVALGAGLFESVQAAAAASDVQADLQATLLSTKGVSGMTLASLNALAEGFQNTTRFEDDTTLKGEAMLLTFTNIGKDVFPAATEAMLNMGQKFGSVDAAALQLGKALNDPVAGVGALRRVGVQLTDQQEEQIKTYMKLGDVEGAQKVILGELQTEFGGLAVAAGTTFAGKLDILKNKFEDVKEKIGGAILPALTTLADKLIEVMNKPEVQGAITALSNWFADVLPKAIDAGSGLLNDLSKNGITGVLKQAQIWVNDQNTQAMLQNAGMKAGEGIVAGIRAAVTSIPAWAKLGEEIGKVAIPIFIQTGAGIGAGLINGIMDALDLHAYRVGVTPPLHPPGYASGGIVPGALGSPQLAVVHGGETITPAGGGGGFGGGGLTFVYAPTLSLADEREAQAKLLPILDAWYAGAKRRRV